jgi:hypothetical protein
MGFFECCVVVPAQQKWLTRRRPLARNERAGVKKIPATKM